MAESAVIASPDEMHGEIVKAFVILAPGYSASPELASELQEHVKKATAPYKYPREIGFVEALHPGLQRHNTGDAQGQHRSHPLHEGSCFDHAVMELTIGRSLWLARAWQEGRAVSC